MVSYSPLFGLMTCYHILHRNCIQNEAHKLHRYNGVRSVKYQQWDGIVFCPLNVVFSPGVFSLFRHFAWRLFVISSFRMASFRYFVFSLGVFSLFRLFAWRLFVISSFRVAFFRLFAWRSGKAKRRNNARRKDEITKKRHAK